MELSLQPDPARSIAAEMDAELRALSVHNTPPP